MSTNRFGVMPLWYASANLDTIGVLTSVNEKFSFYNKEHDYDCLHSISSTSGALNELRSVHLLSQCVLP